MPTPPTRENALLNTVQALGLAAVVGAIIIGVLLALPDSQNPATVLTLVLGFLGTQLPGLVANVHGRRANEKLDKVLNGTMDRKIEDAVERTVERILRRHNIIPDQEA